MSLVFAGICSHAPGITGRAGMADPAQREPFYAAYHRLREQLRAARPEALIVVAAEHFANFFMNNMPSFAIGMADRYSGPIEDPAWLAIPRTSIPGDAALSRELIREIMQTVDVAFAEEWKFDHGIMVPLSFLTPAYDLPNHLGQVYLRYLYTGRIFADNGDGLALPGYGVLGLGGNFNLTPRLNLNVSVDNATDALGLTEGNPRQGFTQSVVNGNFYGRGIIGTNALAQLTYKF